jgi:hypothetical protein
MSGLRGRRVLFIRRISGRFGWRRVWALGLEEVEIIGGWWGFMCGGEGFGGLKVML